MYAKVVLVAALAGSAVAIADLRPDRVRRDLLPRQTSETDVAADPCLNALATVYANAPTVPPEVVSYEMTAAPQTDPCSVSFPAELSAEYSSYTSAVLSWVDANSASIASALSECSTLTDFATDLPVCSATSAADDSAKTTSGSQTETSAGSGATGTRNGPSKVFGNAGPRETGLMAAAAVAAGFVGVAAFL